MEVDLVDVDLLFKGRPHILEEIMKFFRPRDLINCRLVSKQWEEGATKIMKKTADYDLTIRLKDDDNVKKYLCTMRGSRAVPFVSYEIMFGRKNVLNGKEILEEFKSVCGSAVKVLLLSECEPAVCISNLREGLIQNVILGLPNLVHLKLELDPSLKLEFNDPIEYESTQELQVMSSALQKISIRLTNAQLNLSDENFWSTIFSFTTNLNCLDLCHRSLSPESACIILKAFKRTNRIEHLKNLTFFHLSNDLLDELLSSTFALEQFRVSVPFEEAAYLLTCYRKLKSFLETQSNSLKMLRLSWDTILILPFEIKEFREEFMSRKLAFNLPRMPELLNLRVDLSSNFDYKYSPFNFFRTNFSLDLPKLEVLTLNSGAFLMPPSEMDPLEPFPNLQCLELDIYLGNPQDVIPNLGRRFPNIKKLRVFGNFNYKVSRRIQNEIFSVREWADHLKQLEIRDNCGVKKGVEKARSVLCGFPKRWRKLMEKQLAEGVVAEEVLESNRKLLDDWVGLHCLKNLEILHISSYQELLDDLFVYFSLSKLKKLREFYFENRSGAKISNQAREYLKKKFPLLQMENVFVETQSRYIDDV